MGVRITGNHVQERSPVALYDSVTGIAFGEVFETAEEAQEFLDWLGAQDARGLSSAALADARRQWLEVRAVVGDV